MGWPLRSEEFGGGFVYNMSEGRVSIGFVIGLDYLDPKLDPHARFQEFKTHPHIRSILEGGTLYSYGAKAAGFISALCRPRGTREVFTTGRHVAIRDNTRKRPDRRFRAYPRSGRSVVTAFKAAGPEPGRGVVRPRRACRTSPQQSSEKWRGAPWSDVESKVDFGDLDS